MRRPQASKPRRLHSCYEATKCDASSNLRSTTCSIGPLQVLFLLQACTSFVASASHRCALGSHVNTTFPKSIIARAAGLTCKPVSPQFGEQILLLGNLPVQLAPGELQSMLRAMHIRPAVWIRLRRTRNWCASDRSSSWQFCTRHAICCMPSSCRSGSEAAVHQVAQVLPSRWRCPARLAQAADSTPSARMHPCSRRT